MKKFDIELTDKAKRILEAVADETNDRTDIAELYVEAIGYIPNDEWDIINDAIRKYNKAHGFNPA